SGNSARISFNSASCWNRETETRQRPPGDDALFQGRVGEGAAAPEDSLKLPLLGGSWPQFLLERLAQARLTHGYCSSSWRSPYSRNARTISPLSERSCCLASVRSRSMSSAGTRIVILVCVGWLSMHSLCNHNECNATR